MSPASTNTSIAGGTGSTSSTGRDRSIRHRGSQNQSRQQWRSSGTSLQRETTLRSLTIRLTRTPEPILAADAARLLVALQAFSIGGLVTRLPGDPPSAESAHLVKSAVHLVIGANLFETLLLNLTAIESGTGPLNLIPEENRPAWELDLPVAAARTPAGLLDLLTWQSRRVLLFPNADGSVSRVTIMAGLSFPAGLLWK